MRELKIGIAIKLIAILASIYGMAMTIENAMSFTYFTNLSNIMIDIVLLIFLISDVVSLVSKQPERERKNWLYIVKYMMTICITLTFLIYLLILAPTSDAGFFQSYLRNGAGSLCVHLITPVLAIIDFIMFDYRYQSNYFHAVYAVIPPLCYVVYVVVAATGFGVRWENMYAPYNFLNFGAETGWFGFDTSLMSSETLGIGVFYMIIVLLVIFIGIGEIYLLLKNKRGKARQLRKM